MNSISKETNEIKLIPEMLNLLGCSKDNFKKLLQKMNYKIKEKYNEADGKVEEFNKQIEELETKIKNELGRVDLRCSILQRQQIH